MKNRRPFTGIALLACTGVLSIFLVGCSAFQSSRQIDMTPFAENTSAMFAEAAKVGRQPKWNYLKPFVNIPEIVRLRQSALPLIRGLRGIVMYSNQIVALNMSAKTDKEKCTLLKMYFKDAEAKIADRARFDSIGVSTTMMDTVYSNIERASTFREGLEAASPLVNAVVLAMQRRLDEIDADLPLGLNALDQAVESAYASRRRNYDELIRVQAEFQHAAVLLYDGRRGNREAFNQALEVDPTIREFFASVDKPAAKEFDNAEMALTGRLGRIEGFLHQLDGEKAMYIARQQELEDIRINVDTRVKIARDAIMVWAQSHRNLGAGIAVPPLIDVAGIAGGLARKVVPLP